MIAGRRLITDELPDRILLAEEPLCECLVEYRNLLCVRQVAVAEHSSSQQRNAHGVKVMDTDVVLFSMHLRRRKVRLAGNMDSRIPDAARNAAHLHGGIANEGQGLDTLQNALIQFGKALLLESASLQIQMHRQDMLSIKSGIERAQVKQCLRKERSHREQQE